MTHKTHTQPYGKKSKKGETAAYRATHRIHPKSYAERKQIALAQKTNKKVTK